ncbi:response regulator transcription factor [Chloroflexota bacterium]
MKNGIKIFLLDSNEPTCYNLRHMLGKEKDIEVIGDCHEAEEAITKIKVACPDIVFVSTQLSGMRGIEIARQLKMNGLGYDIGIIMLAESQDDMLKILEDGTVDYYIIKDTTKDTYLTEFAQVIRQVDKNMHSPKTRFGFPEESVEVAIPLTNNRIKLSNFIYRLEERFRDNSNFARIYTTIGSWNQGTIIKILTRLGMDCNLFEILNNMPEVETLEEEPIGDSTLSRLARRFGVHRASSIGSSKRIHVTLKEGDMIPQVYP